MTVEANNKEFIFDNAIRIITKNPEKSMLKSGSDLSNFMKNPNLGI